MQIGDVFFRALMMKKEKAPQQERAIIYECDKIVNPTLNMKEKESQA